MFKKLRETLTGHSSNKNDANSNKSKIQNPDTADLDTTKEVLSKDIQAPANNPVVAHSDTIDDTNSVPVSKTPKKSTTVKKTSSEKKISTG
jgi:hypothetical protein